MKSKILIFVPLYILICNYAQAEPLNSSHCPMFGDIAKTTMQKRQENVLMSDMITAIESKIGKNDPIAKMAKTIIIQAYERPLYTTEEIKRQEINDFANKILSVCYTIYK